MPTRPGRWKAWTGGKLARQVRPANDANLVTAYAITALIDAASIERLLDQYTVFLEQLLTTSDTTIAQLALMNAPQRAEMLALVSGPVLPPPEQSVVDVFEAMVERYPDRPALGFGDQTYTYQALNQRVNRLANWLLQSGGLQRESVVALCLDRSDRYWIALLGVMKAGGAFLPIDKNLPAARRLYMVQQADTQVILCDDSNLAWDDVVPVYQYRRVMEPAETVDNPNIPISSDLLAYVLYTSGTTGRPKGAQGEMAGMLNHLLAKVADFAIDEHSVVAQNASISFDISIWQGLVALLKGGRTQVYPQEAVLSPAQLLPQIARDGVTILEVLPSYLN